MLKNKGAELAETAVVANLTDSVFLGGMLNETMMELVLVEIM